MFFAGILSIIGATAIGAATVAGAQGYGTNFDSYGPDKLAENLAVSGITFSSIPSGSWRTFPAFFRTLNLGQLFQADTPGSLDIAFAEPVSRCSFRFAQYAVPGTSSLVVEGFSGSTLVGVASQAAGGDGEFGEGIVEFESGTSFDRIRISSNPPSTLIAIDDIWAGCQDLTRSKVKIGRLDTPPGDDRLMFKGDVTIPQSVTSALDPLANGVRILVEDREAGGFDVTIPGGAFIRSAGVGWKVNAKGTKWTYVGDELARETLGVSKVVIKAESGATSGVRVLVKGKAGAYDVPPASLPLRGRIVLDPADGYCAEVAFDDNPLYCEVRKNGGTIACQ